MIVKVKAPGSCGELVQGTLDGENFLITCPIDLYSAVEIIPGNQTFITNAGMKVTSAKDKTLQYLQVSNNSFQIVVHSDLPSGKGMASSSSDISATCQAIALSMGHELSPDEIADIALSIEPTDGIFYPGIVMFDHVSGKIRRHLGIPPQIQIAIFDVGGEVDTLHFNRRSDLSKLNHDKEARVREAVDLVSKGLKIKDAALIGQGATISALANQSILFKPCLEKIINLIPKYGAVGVNAAHSGTVIGVLFSADHSDLCPECIVAIQGLCPEVKYLRTVQLISGGLMKQESDSDEWKNCF